MPRSLLLVLSRFHCEAICILVIPVLFRFKIFTGSQRISRRGLHKRDISGQEVRYRRIPYT